MTKSSGRKWMQGWIVIKRKASLTLGAAKCNLCEEKVDQVSETGGHGMPMLYSELVSFFFSLRQLADRARATA
jgi:hypothetical protein